MYRKWRNCTKNTTLQLSNKQRRWWTPTSFKLDKSCWETVITVYVNKLHCVKLIGVLQQFFRVQSIADTCTSEGRPKLLQHPIPQISCCQPSPLRRTYPHSQAPWLTAKHVPLTSAADLHQIHNQIDQMATNYRWLRNIQSLQDVTSKAIQIRLAYRQDR